MAAGLGFKTFAVGEVLSAANVNGYLMQGVLVFANATARDAAITSPQEGQFAFTKDNDSLWYYSGSAWVSSGATGDIEGVTAGTGISGGGTSGTVTVTNSMATAIDAKGDLIVGTGADTFARLGVGTNGHTIVADSAEATGLKWAAPSSGALTKITSATFTGVASVDVDACFTSTYKRYLVIVKSFAATVADDFQMQWRESGVTKTSGYFGGNYGINRDNTTEGMSFNNQAAITLSSTSGISNSNPGNYQFYLDNVGTGSTLSARFWGTGFQGDNAQQALWYGGQGSGIVTGFRLKSSASNITGEYAVYGLEN